MARRWTNEEEQHYKTELLKLYVEQNKTIKEVGMILGISEKTVFQRLTRLSVKTQREKKTNVNNKRADIALPKRSKELAEFFGIMLGDGHISHFQTTVTLGNKELSYAEYVKALTKYLFGGEPKISTKRGGYRTVYLGSVDVVQWLHTQGLLNNKVRNQVGVPDWILTKKTYQQHFLRGFFDTDGSVYRLKYGIQINLSNRSTPILKALQLILLRLEYTPSKISCNKIYITKSAEVKRFFGEIQPKNLKHLNRYKTIISSVGTQAVNEGRL